MGIMKWMTGTAVALGALAAATIGATAQDYPNKVVTIVVAAPTGGSNDLMARAIADELTKKLGQTVIVENKPGASGNVGTAFVAGAKPDGYTLLLNSIASTVINPSLYKNLTYDYKSFAPIAKVAASQNVLIVHPSVPANTLQEFIAYVKSKPEDVLYGSVGNGSISHLAAVLFQNATGTKMTHIPYNGAAPTIPDILSGRISAIFHNPVSMIAHVQSGAVKALVVTGSERLAPFPDVPTMKESGYPDFVVESWYGISAPAGTPKEIIDLLSKDMLEVMALPNVRQVFEKSGIEVSATGSEEFGALMKSESERWADVIAKAGVTVD
ncbi:MAG: tripartite tricarboxylate transporter substrate binding protein [Rhizobiaceae bacterium]